MKPWNPRRVHGFHSSNPVPPLVVVVIFSRHNEFLVRSDFKRIFFGKLGMTTLQPTGLLGTTIGLPLCLGACFLTRTKKLRMIHLALGEICYLWQTPLLKSSVGKWNPPEMSFLMLTIWKLIIWCLGTITISPHHDTASVDDCAESSTSMLLLSAT